MTAAPAPRVMLLDGFSLHLGRSQPRLLLDDVPHGVQRLVALALRGVRPSEHTTRPVRGIGRLHPATR